MACTSGCWTEQKGSPCLKGLPNVRELSQANLNSGFLIYLSSVCRRPRGDVSVLSSQPHVHIPEPGTAVVVLEKNVAEEKGGMRMEKGVGDSAKPGAFSGCAAAHPEHDCAPQIQNSPNGTILGNISHKTAFFVTAGCCWLASMKLIPLLILPRAVQRPHQSWAALHSGSFELLWMLTSCSTGSSCWMEHNWSWIPGLFCVSPYFSFPLHLPSFPSQPFSTSGNLILASKCFCQHQVSKTLWQIHLGRTVFAPFSTSGKPCALKGAEGFSINHCSLKKTIDAFKKIQSCYMKPVTKMLLTWPFISCSLREKVV